MCRRAAAALMGAGSGGQLRVLASDGYFTLPGGFECAGYRLSAPRMIGAGAHGTVYADADAGPVLAKLSHSNTATVVAEECAMLRRLEVAGVPHVERCLGLCDLGRRSVSILSPYFKGGHQISTGVVDALDARALETLIRDSAVFIVQSLAAGVAISDLQTLVRPDGRLLFIDLTEAGSLEDALGPSRALQSLGEWCTVLPQDVHGRMAEAVADELDRFGAGTLSPVASAALAEMPLLAAPEASRSRLEKAALRAGR
mmetsp:Transcript_48899/g.150985  ORF Transcript_48899/g.150985 Transcript_48899/m.150985 type:complete len:257 (+) Transcript_48899:225-995(+)